MPECVTSDNNLVSLETDDIICLQYKNRAPNTTFHRIIYIHRPKLHHSSALKNAEISQTLQ